MTDTSHDLSLAERIDAVCDQFEQDFRAGQKPQIESCLGDSTEPFRSALLRALVGLEIELRQKRGEKIRPEEYYARFPDHKDAIQLIFAEVRSILSSVKVSGAATSTGPTVVQGQSSSSSSPLEKLGRFEILSTLGEGAFGTVYKAYDPQLDRHVALKVPRFGSQQSKEDRERFLREARSAAGLHHPQICPVHEVGTIDGHDYIVMAFIDGKPLSKVIQAQATISDKQVASVIRRIAVALQEAHEKGVIHRDLKPANVMINRKGEPVIMDFGLARRSNSGDAQISQTGQIMGTPAYMSPEQARGDGKSVGPAADIYSLGVMLYELLCGRRPFEGTISEVIGQILHVEPVPPSQHRPGVDKRLEAICLKSMARKSGDRYVSMKDLAAALAEYTKSSSTAQPKEKGTVDVPAEDEALQTRQFAKLMAAVSSDLEARVERAAGRAVRQSGNAHKAKIPWWTYLIGSGLMGVIVLCGIFFFIRKDTVTVIVNIPDIDPKDASLSFLLDGAAIAAELFAAPIELKPGEHELIVNKDGKLFKQFRFSVGKADNEPVVVQDVTPPEPDLPAQESDGWTSLFNGKDLTGWTPESGDAENWQVQDGAIVGIGEAVVPRPGAETWLLSDKEYRDFALRFEFRTASETVNSGFAFRVIPRERPPVGADTYPVPTHLQVEIFDNSANRANQKLMTGTVLGSLGPQLVIPGNPPVMQRPGNEWNRMEVEVRGQSIGIRLNGGELVKGSLDDLLARGATYPGLKRKTGRIGFQRLRGNIHFRDIQVKELPAQNDGWIDVFNGRDLSNWVMPDGKSPSWKVENGYLEVVPGVGAIVTQSLVARSLVTKDTYPADFELHAEFWLPSQPEKKDQARANSGIYLLGRHEIQICDGFQNPISRPMTACGALYGEIAPTANACTAPETWQTFDISFQSPRFDGQKNVTTPGRLTLIHNGATVIKDAPVTSIGSPGRNNENAGQPGPIVLQDHGSKVRFRNIRIRPLQKPNPKPAEVGFVPLFNGQDLTGWKTVGTPKWSWSENRLIGTPPPGGGVGFLMTEADYENFELALQYRLNAGMGSGLFLRTDPNGEATGKGQLEIQIADDDAFNLQPLVANGAVYNVFARRTSPPFQRGDWNSLRVRLNQRQIEVWVNDTQTIDANLDTVHDKFATVPGLNRKSGRIALQQNQKVDVEFRHVRIRNLDQPSIPVDTQTFNGHAYKFFPEQLAWKDAKARCEALGGHLVIIETLDENTFLGRLITDRGKLDSWIGATDEGSEGQWHWVDGRNITWTNWFKRQNQPNNKGGVEHFGVMSNQKLAVDGLIGWEWADQPNESLPAHQPGYICEWDAEADELAR